MTPARSRSLEDVWEAFADQFLDTETRTEIPRIALTCLEAGLDREGAFNVWAYDVTPALWPNLWDVAGEWCGWDHDWLLERIASKRVRPSWWAHFVYRSRIHLAHANWVAIAECIDLLRETPLSERAKVAADLTWLAAQFFDFGASTETLSSVGALRELYHGAFAPIFARLVVGGSAESLGTCTERVERALSLRVKT
jgi:hypothetical protein